MDSGIKRTQKDYTLAFKLAVVEQVEKGELTYKQAQDRYGIQGRSTVLVWLRKHGRQNWGPMAHYGRMSKPNPSPNSPTLTPEQRIKGKRRPNPVLTPQTLSLSRRSFTADKSKCPGSKSSPHHARMAWCSGWSGSRMASRKSA